MKKFAPILASFSVLAALSGCGGGDGGGDPVDVAKYAGTWEGCIAGASGSTRETVVVTKKDDSSATAASTIVLYPGPGCTGTPNPNPDQHVLTYNFKGTKTVAGETVDKVDMVEGAVTQKNVFLIKGTQFRFGPDNGPRDGDGYPETLDADFLTKK